MVEAIEPPLALPDPDHLPPLDRLAQVPSVALFLQRAQMIDLGFQLSDENARAVAELVVRLDGLPLAIELAAARTQLLSPQMLLERLGQRLSLLHWKAQDLPERQQTLRAAIAWSYDLLSPEEQALFRCLSVFVGGFTPEAAETVLTHAQTQAVDVLEGLAPLVDKSLILAEEDGQGGYRFRLLESMRGFVLEQITSCSEGEPVGRAHAQDFLELAERAAPELIGSNQREWFLRLEQEHENLRAALRWLWDHGENEPAVRMVAALGYFWQTQGYVREGVQALEEALERVPAADSRLRARVLNRLGSLLTWQGEAERSQVALEEALALGRALDDAGITVQALSNLGERAELVGGSDRSMREATQLLEEALTLHRQMENRRGAAKNVDELARIALAQGDYERAEQLGQESLATYREIDDETDAIQALLYLGLAVGEQGRAAPAVALLREGLDALRRLQDRRLFLLAGQLINWWLAGEHRDSESLAMLLGAAEALSEVVGTLSSGWQKARTAEAAAALAARLGTERFEAARREGRRLSFSQIWDLMTQVLNGAEAGVANGGAMQRMPGGTKRQQTLLSRREEEVLQLVAEGLTNKGIARQLTITEHTVKAHVTFVFNKLGVDSRAQAVAVAAHGGLLDMTTVSASEGAWQPESTGKAGWTAGEDALAIRLRD